MRGAFGDRRDQTGTDRGELNLTNQLGHLFVNGSSPIDEAHMTNGNRHNLPPSTIDMRGPLQRGAGS